jgi:hypothetical protein
MMMLWMSKSQHSAFYTVSYINYRAAPRRWSSATWLLLREFVKLVSAKSSNCPRLFTLYL